MQENKPDTYKPTYFRRRTGLGDGARALLTVAAAIIVLFGMREARDLLVPIMMAVFLAIISYSLTDILRRFLKFPHWLAVTFTVLVDCGVIFGIISVIKFLAADMKNTLQGDLVARFAEKYHQVMTWLDHLGLGEQARTLVESPQDILGTQQIISISQAITGHVLSFMSICTLVLILMTFLLGEAPLFQRNFRSLPNSVQGKSEIRSALRGVQRYLFIKTIASACTGVLAWWLCAAMDVPFAFLWGFVAYVLNYIPTIGSIVAAISPILMALLLGSWGDAFIVTGGYIAINFAIGNGIEPLFLGKQFGIATSVVLLSVLLWGWVWGPLGMLLAVPITVLTKLALKNSPDLSWVALIIDDTPHESDTQTTTQK